MNKSMPRNYNTARRVDFILKFFPKLRQRIEYVGAKYHQIRENWDYDISYNGERWLVQTLAREKLLNVVFDVGANRGDWTAMALEASPEARVHCFEICPPMFQKLATRFADRNIARNIFLNPFGLSDSESEIKIHYFSRGDGGGALYDIMNRGNSEIVNAKVSRGGDYCERHHIRSIDLLKMDVEGSEHLVLRGFGDMIHPGAIPVIQFEYGMGSIVTKFLLKDFYEYFRSRGYKVGKLFPNSIRFREYRLQDENFLGPNYVAASPEMAQLLKGVA
ncbi:MAG: FkbM family methyltransferase [Limisphaerales bacterium]